MQAQGQVAINGLPKVFCERHGASDIANISQPAKFYRQQAFFDREKLFLEKVCQQKMSLNACFTFQRRRDRRYSGQCWNNNLAWRKRKKEAPLHLLLGGFNLNLITMTADAVVMMQT
jgi:hypothetical protein